MDSLNTKTSILKELLKKDFTSLSDADKNNIIDYCLTFDLKGNLKVKVVDFFTAHFKSIPPLYREQVRDFLLEEALTEARKDFYTYAKLMAPVVLPNDFIDGRHIKLICKELQAVADSVELPTPTRRSMIFLPPGAMKTVLCSILFPSWLFGVHPNWQVIAVGYNDEFAMDKIGAPLRELMLSKEYSVVFPNTVIRQDSRGKDRFVTTRKGEFKALGGRARAAGRRAHLLICDDTVSEKDAWSKAFRQEINNNYIGGLRSRLTRTPRGAELVVSTRYHLDDLAGHLLKVDEVSKRPWNIIKVPAILDQASSDLLREQGDPPDKYTVGTSFWPEMQPMSILEEERDSLMRTEPFKWHALYLQDPVPQDGGLIKVEDFRFWNEKTRGKPKVTQVLVSLDTAYQTTKRSDFSAFTVWGSFVPKEGGPPSLILLKAEYGKWEWPDLVQKCEDIKVRWNPDYFIVEKKSAGQSILQDLYRKGYPLVEFDPRGTKEERLQSASIWFKQGRIWVPEETETGWQLDVIEEITTFPAAPHDDLTDSTSQAILWYRDMGTLEHTRTVDLQGEAPVRRVVKSYWKALVGA